MILLEFIAFVSHQENCRQQWCLEQDELTRLRKENAKLKVFNERKLNTHEYPTLGLLFITNMPNGASTIPLPWGPGFVGDCLYFVKNRQNLIPIFLYFENAYSARQLKTFGIVCLACLLHGMHPGLGGTYFKGCKYTTPLCLLIQYFFHPK